MPRYSPSHCPYCGTALEDGDAAGGTCPSCGELTVQQPVVAVEVLVVDGEEVLLQQRGTGRKSGRWGFPGGHVEPGEAPWTAAVRELEEETGLTAPEESLGLADVVFDANPDGTYYLVVGFGLPSQRTSGSLDASTDETAGLRFCSPSAIPEGLTLFAPEYRDRMRQAVRTGQSDRDREEQRFLDLR
ncbi:MAG: NUDIX hydrolase [Halobacteriales archaeon]